MDADLVPTVGLGTAGYEDRARARAWVDEAIAAGYRHLDTAQQYRHSAAVGAAVRAADVPREELSVATKLHSESLAPDSVTEQTEAILDRLGLSYVDALYVHWPAHTYDPERTLAAMARLRDRGLVRHLGVCNFTPDLLREATETSPAPVRVHQFEMHPFLPQDDLLSVCRERDVHPVAHTPLAGGRVLESETLQSVAAERAATVPQVVLAWLLRRGVSPVPKATGDHLRENHAATAVELTDDDVARIESVDRRRRVVDYEFAPWR